MSTCACQFEFRFACLWTHLDRVGLQFLMFCNVLDEKARQSNAMTCMSLRMSGTCHSSHARLNLRSLGPSKTVELRYSTLGACVC